MAKEIKGVSEEKAQKIMKQANSLLKLLGLDSTFEMVEIKSEAERFTVASKYKTSSSSNQFAKHPIFVRTYEFTEDASDDAITYIITRVMADAVDSISGTIDVTK